MAKDIKNTEATEVPNGNFIHTFIEEDIAEGGRFEGKKVHTRFPPEPNGYLHIGHAKAICIDFGTAEKFGGICNLRMDDTNPTKEDVEYVDAIKEDVSGSALTGKTVSTLHRNTLTKCTITLLNLSKRDLHMYANSHPVVEENGSDTKHSGKSPYRDRPIEESLDLFARMKAGEFEDGKMTRAKIDLASDALICVTLLFTEFNRLTHRTGDKWCIYLCTILRTRLKMLSRVSLTAFAHLSLTHRPLYDWVINNISVPNKPRQIEVCTSWH